METFTFLFLSVVAIGAAIVMVTNKHAVYSALFLVINMIALAGVYLLLDAQFLAMIQILVYAGAIMVLFLFVIMLLNLENEEKVFTEFNFKYLASFFLASVVLAQLLYVILDWTDTLPVVSPEMVSVGTVEAVGDVMFTDYLYPFEVTAILLTAAVVGALLIAQRKVNVKK